MRSGSAQRPPGGRHNGNRPFPQQQRTPQRGQTFDSNGPKSKSAVAPIRFLSGTSRSLGKLRSAMTVSPSKISISTPSTTSASPTPAATAISRGRRRPPPMPRHKMSNRQTHPIQTTAARLGRRSAKLHIRGHAKPGRPPGSASNKSRASYVRNMRTYRARWRHSSDRPCSSGRSGASGPSDASLRSCRCFAFSSFLTSTTDKPGDVCC